MILVGLGLIFGILTRWQPWRCNHAVFYFIAYPPVPGYTFGVPVEGSYLWVNKTLIEFFVLGRIYLYFFRISFWDRQAYLKMERVKGSQARA